MLEEEVDLRFFYYNRGYRRTNIYHTSCQNIKTLRNKRYVLKCETNLVSPYFSHYYASVVNRQNGGVTGDTHGNGFYLKCGIGLRCIRNADLALDD